MERLSENAINIINSLHTDRLDYHSEYVPLIDAANSLAAYEDAGLEHEEVQTVKSALMGKVITEIKEFEGVPIDRLRELAQADQEGRLVVLPCYTGDKVYMPILGQILELEVGSIVINGGVITIYYYSSSFRSSPDDFGKTVFLTREEAEAAVKKQKNTICKEE